VNKPPADVPRAVGWHHGVVADLSEEERGSARRKLLCPRRKRTRHWLAVSWRHMSRETWTQ
jgi:hypothetical protein